MNLHEEDPDFNYQATQPELPPAPAPLSSTASSEIAASVTIGPPTSELNDPQNVEIFINSFTPVSEKGSSVAAFDVVFSVTVYQQSESAYSSTYQIIKRIGVDRLKIAKEVLATTPVSIVEAKKPPEPALVSQVRARTLAGLK